MYDRHPHDARSDLVEQFQAFGDRALLLGGVTAYRGWTPGLGLTTKRRNLQDSEVVTFDCMSVLITQA